MSKISNLKAVATDYEIPVGELIDYVVSHPKEMTPDELDSVEAISRRIIEAERNLGVAAESGISPDYINGLKDARKLIAGERYARTVSSSESQNPRNQPVEEDKRA